MALRQIPGYRDRAPASKCNAYECTVPVYQCPKLGLAKQGNLESLAGRRMDEPLAGKSIEAVAHGRHADAQFRSEPGGFTIGRAHVCTPVTNAHLVCRLL